MKDHRDRAGRRPLAQLVVLFLAVGWAISMARGQDGGAPSPANPPPTSGVTNSSSGADAANDDSMISTRSVLQIMHDGGPLMYPIAGCSFLLLVFVFERAIALRRGRVIPGPFVSRLLTQLDEELIDRDEALDLCEENGSPVAVVLAAAVKKWGKPAVEVEQAILDSGERVTGGLRRYVRLFNAISTISPLLGLLGTVMGMITSFNTIAKGDAMGRPELLAGGIGEALLTTAGGLAVAIPALIAYWVFVSRVDRLVGEIDSIGQQVVDLISAEAIVEANRRREESKKKKAAAADDDEDEDEAEGRGEKDEKGEKQSGKAGEKTRRGKAA